MEDASNLEVEMEELMKKGDIDADNSVGNAVPDPENAQDQPGHSILGNGGHARLLPRGDDLRLQPLRR